MYLDTSEESGQGNGKWYLHDCVYCEMCNMSRTVIENGSVLDDPIPACYNEDCIYESQICDGTQDTSGWKPGIPDCMDGSDEAEYLCHALHLEVANDAMNKALSGSEDYWEIDDEGEDDGEDDGRWTLKKSETECGENCVEIKVNQ